VLRTANSTATPVNSVSWAPYTLGPILAAATADGFVTFIAFTEKGEADLNMYPPIEAHKGGCNAVSWAPDVRTGAIISKSGPSGTQQAKVLRLVTGGCDTAVRIWRYVEKKWSSERFVNNDNKHSDWVRDVAWAPSLGLPASIIASASEDKTVVIWSEDKTDGWVKKHTLEFTQKVWKVSWSVMGNILAVSQGDNNVSLWKQSLDGWQKLTT